MRPLWQWGHSTAVRWISSAQYGQALLSVIRAHLALSSGITGRLFERFTGANFVEHSRSHPGRGTRPRTRTARIPSWKLDRHQSETPGRPSRARIREGCPRSPRRSPPSSRGPRSRPDRSPVPDSNRPAFLPTSMRSRGTDRFAKPPMPCTSPPPR